MYISIRTLVLSSAVLLLSAVVTLLTIKEPSAKLNQVAVPPANTITQESRQEAVMGIKEISVREASKSVHNTNPFCSGVIQDLILRANMADEESVERILVPLVDVRHVENGNVVSDTAHMSSILDSDLDARWKPMAFKMFVGTLSLEPERASALLKHFASDPRVGPRAAAEAGYRISHVAPKDSFNTMLELPYSPEYNEPFAAIVASWVIDKPELASKTVLEKLRPDSPLYDWAVAGIVQATRFSDPGASTEWEKMISSEAARNHAKGMAYTSRYH